MCLEISRVFTNRCIRCFQELTDTPAEEPKSAVLSVASPKKLRGRVAAAAAITTKVAPTAPVKSGTVRSTGRLVKQVDNVKTTSASSSTTNSRSRSETASENKSAVSAVSGNRETVGSKTSSGVALTETNEEKKVSSPVSLLTLFCGSVKSLCFAISHSMLLSLFILSVNIVAYQEPISEIVHVNYVNIISFLSRNNVNRHHS